MSRSCRYEYSRALETWKTTILDDSHPSTCSTDCSETASQSESDPYRFLDYRRTRVIRPGNAEVEKLLVLANTRLTPEQYDRNIFNLVLRVQGTCLSSYDVGDCVSVYAQNPFDKVNEFIAGAGFHSTEILELDSFFLGKEDGVYMINVLQLCTEYFDLFGAPTRSFYAALSKFARDYVEREQLAVLSLSKSPDFVVREAQAVTYASTILEFPSLLLTPTDLLDLVPLLKPRLYSIASSREAHPGEVHLLVVTHTWENSKGEERIGLTTGYLESMQPSDSPLPLHVVAALVRSPVLKLPSDPTAPVIMVGMGTGMAPFRGFIEQRSAMRNKCQDIGPMRLYYGARHKHSEFLYQDELEAYALGDWLTLRCAWSRDQAQKIYVQMLIEEDSVVIWNSVRPEVGGSIYICGPMAPLPDIKKALAKVFDEHGCDSRYLDVMEAAGRFATEVY